MGTTTLIVVAGCGGARSSNPPTTTPSPAVSAPPAASVSLAAGVAGPESRPADRLLPAGAPAPCRGESNGEAGATYAPSVLVYTPDGALRWALCPPQPLGAQLVGVVGGIVLVQFAGGEQFLGAYDEATGALRWAKPFTERNARVDGGVVVVRNYVALTDAVLDPLTGAEQAVPAGSTAPVRADGIEVVLGDRAGAPPWGRRVDARDLASAQVRWSRSDLGAVPAGGIAIGDGVVVVITAADAPQGNHPATPSLTTRVLDLATGAERWQAPGGSTGASAAPSPSISGAAAQAIRAGTVLVDDGERVEARSLTDGAVRWTMTEDRVLSGAEQIEVAGPAPDVVVTARPGFDVRTDHFEVRDLATGRVLWSALGSDRGLVSAAGTQRLVAADLRLFDIHTGRQITALAVPCLGDPACSVHETYVQHLALDAAHIIVAVNFGGR